MAQDAREVYALRPPSVRTAARVSSPAMDSTDSRRRVYTVSRLLQDVQRHLETGFGTLWLEGELSNLARPASGHLYFSLKDAGGQIRSAMFRGRNRHVDFRPENGTSVLVRGRPGLYLARGDFQLIVEHMEPAGAGRLQAAFERLRRTLDERGWFAADTKRPPPPAPATIGVVTSPSGAAVRDVLQVLARRAPGTRVIVYPTTTQGAAAAADIARALGRAGRRAEAEVLLLVRGGGSLEDLQAFNELAVAEALHACPLPVISGVGHETDVTIADLVADLRAPTPSAAAELAVPDGAVLAVRAARAAEALGRAGGRLLAARRERAAALAARLQAHHPERRLGQRMQRVDELEERLGRAGASDRERRGRRLDTLSERLAARHPGRAIAARRARLDTLTLRLGNGGSARVGERGARLALAMRALDAVSPLAVLERGYAVVRGDADRGGARVVTDAATLERGERLDVRLARGRFAAIVATIDGAGGDPPREAAADAPGSLPKRKA